MVAAKTCSSCKKLFDAKDIRNNLCEKCLAAEVVKHWWYISLTTHQAIPYTSNGKDVEL